MKYLTLFLGKAFSLWMAILGSIIEQWPGRSLPLSAFPTLIASNVIPHRHLGLCPKKLITISRLIYRQEPSNSILMRMLIKNLFTAPVSSFDGTCLTHFSCCFLRFSSFTLDTGTDFLFGYSATSLIDFKTATPSRLAYESFSEAFDLVRNIVTKRVRMWVTGSSFPIFFR